MFNEFVRYIIYIQFLGMKWYIIIVYSRRVNSAFHARWLAGSEVINKHYSPPSSQRDNIAYHNSMTKKKK